MTDLTFGLYYDFRCIDSEPGGLARRWAGILEQVTWAEQLGFGSVWISEHHFVDDAYASSTLTLAGPVALSPTPLGRGRVRAWAVDRRGCRSEAPIPRSTRPTTEGSVRRVQVPARGHSDIRPLVPALRAVLVGAKNVIRMP